jgi:hypothetical protein
MNIVRHAFCLGALLCCILQGAKAEAPIPPQLREKGMKSVSVRRTLSFPDLSQYSPGTVACTISFSDFYFGYLRDEKFYRLNKWPFSSACYKATDPDPSKPNLADGLSVNFDVNANRWVKDRSRFEAHLRAQGMEEEWVKKYADADRFYELATQTAKGFAMTRDDVIGDESRRERHLHYCLIREPKAICGQGVMGTLKDIKKRPKTDLTPYALQILRTVEFVDDDSSTARANHQEGAASNPSVNNLDHPASSP